MRSVCFVLLAASPFVSFTARADIVYDNITGHFPGNTYATVVSHELAQGVTLAGGPTVLQSVELALRNLNTGIPYDADVWAGIYADAGGTPGALIDERIRPVHLDPSQILAVAFDFSGVQTSGPTVWISFKAYSELLGVGGGSSPTVGSTAGIRANRSFQNGVWFPSPPGSGNFAIRITSVPGPASIGLFAIAPVALSRPRRRG